MTQQNNGGDGQQPHGHRWCENYQMFHPGQCWPFCNKCDNRHLNECTAWCTRCDRQAGHTARHCPHRPLRANNNRSNNRRGAISMHRGRSRGGYRGRGTYNYYHAPHVYHFDFRGQNLATIDWAALYSNITGMIDDLGPTGRGQWASPIRGGNINTASGRGRGGENQ